VHEEAARIDELLARGDRPEAVKVLIRLMAEKPAGDSHLREISLAVKRSSENPAGTPFQVPPAQRRQILNALSKKMSLAKAALALFLIDACAGGQDAALFLAARDILDPADPISGVAVELRHLLNEYGIAISPSARVLEEMKREMDRATLFHRLAECLFLAGLSISSPKKLRDEVFETLFLPTLKRFVTGGNSEAALHLEALGYETYLKAEEDAENHKRFFSAVEPLMSAAGRADNKSPPSPISREDPPRVAFVLFNGEVLAHVEVLLYFLKGLSALDKKPIRPAVYLLTGDGKEKIAPHLVTLNVPLMIPDSTSGILSVAEMFQAARKTLAREKISTAIFVSVPLFLDYLMEAPLAPIQIWWPMKFHLPNFSKIDGRVGYGTLFEYDTDIEGVRWRFGPFATPPVPDCDPAEVERVRKKYRGFKILGTIAREEKIQQKDYLEAIVRVLQRNKNTCFLWTGRNQLSTIQDRFTAGGVADRCHFVGWVDPSVYCRVFDIFIETYPLSGLMTGWAMSLAKPVAAVGNFGYLGMHLDGIMKGTIPCTSEERARIDAIFAPVRNRLPFLWAPSAKEIDRMVEPLLADPSLAEELGKAEQAFIRVYLSDPVQSAAIQAKHFAAIIDEKSRRSAN
jgi:hypothetical protein